MMSITRRVFLKNGALAIVGTSVVPSFLTRAVYAADTARSGQEAPDRALPARRRRRPEHCCAAR